MNINWNRENIEQCGECADMGRGIWEIFLGGIQIFVCDKCLKKCVTILLGFVKE